MRAAPKGRLFRRSKPATSKPSRVGIAITTKTAKRSARTRQKLVRPARQAWPKRKSTPESSSAEARIKAPAATQPTRNQTSQTTARIAATRRISPRRSEIQPETQLRSGGAEEADPVPGWKPDWPPPLKLPDEPPPYPSPESSARTQRYFRVQTIRRDRFRISS